MSDTSSAIDWHNPVITLSRAAARVENHGGPVYVVRQLRQAASRCELNGFTNETAAAYEEALVWAICEIDSRDVMGAI